MPTYQPKLCVDCVGCCVRVQLMCCVCVVPSVCVLVRRLAAIICVLTADVCEVVMAGRLEAQGMFQGRGFLGC